MAFVKKKSRVFRVICFILAFLLVQNSLEQVQAQGTPFLPPGRNYFVDLSIPYSLPVLRGMRVYPAKPFEFDFVVDSEDKRTLNKKETSLLIKYFLTCLTIPEEDLWVNLSPYESGRIIPNELALTDAGNNLLEQDKLLKQLTASLTYPESDIGKKFWRQVYKRAYEEFATTNLPVSTYNKVWIVPDRAIVYDMGNSAMIGDTHLKVMLEEDYLAMSKHRSQPRKVRQSPIGEISPEGRTSQGNNLQHLSAAITREIILPELEKEVNEGKNFAPVRQIFHSMVLAAWFKRALKRNVLSRFYVNKKKISGVDDVDKNAKEEIYKQYLRIYKVGAYNYIREDVDPVSQQVVARKYFSGGFSYGNDRYWLKTFGVPPDGFGAIEKKFDSAQTAEHSFGEVKVELDPVGGKQVLASLMNVMADSAQEAVSLRTLTKIISAVALVVSISVASMGGAQAARITPNVDGNTLHVTVENNDTFGAILQQAGIKTPLWGANGAVARVARIVKADIPDVNKIFPGNQFNVPTTGAVKAAQTQGAIPAGPPPSQFKAAPTASPPAIALTVPSFPQHKPAPPAVQATAPAFVPTPAPSPLPIASHAPPPAATQAPAAAQQRPPAVSTPVTHSHTFTSTSTFEKLSWSAAVGGDISNLKPAGTYPKGIELADIVDINLKSRFESKASELASQKKAFNDARSHSAPPAAIQNIEQNIASIEFELAQLKAKMVIGKIIAPFELTILPGYRPPSHVNAGDALFYYFSNQIVYFDLNVPPSFDPVSIKDFLVNGQRVESILKIIPTLAPDGKNVSLKVVVKTAQPLPAAEAKLEITTSDPVINQRLSAVENRSSTFTRVDPIQPVKITASLSGHVRDLVVPGQRVLKHQVLAITADEQLIRQYNDIQDQLKAIGNQLKDETVNGMDRINLIKEQARLNGELTSFRKEIRKTVVLAAYNGIILSVNYDRPDVAAGDTIIEMSPGTVTLSNLLVERNSRLQKGDPFLFKTQSGELLAGVVQNSSDTISNPTMEINSRYVAGQVFDPEGKVRSNQWGWVLWPKTQADKDKIAAVIHDQESMEMKAGAAGGPPPDEYWEKLFPKPHVKTVTVATKGPAVSSFVSHPIALHGTTYSSGAGIDLSHLIKRVRANPLTAFGSKLEYLKSLSAEGLVNAVDLKIQLGVERRTDGRFVPAAGISGGIANVGSASILTGGMYGLADQIFGQVFGNLWGLLSGQNELKLQEAKQVTANLYTQSLIDTREREVQAIELALRIAEIDRNIIFDKDRLGSAWRTGSVAQARASGGWVSPLAGGNAVLSTSVFQTDLQRLEMQKINLTLKLQGLLGTKIDPNQPLTIRLPSENFPGISDVRPIWASLQANNFDLEYARGLIAANGKALDIEGLNGTQFTLGAEYASSNLTNPQLDPSSIRTTSAVTRGAATFTGITIPIFDGTKEIKMRLIQYDKEKLDKAYQQAQVDIQTKFSQAVSQINSLAATISRQISQRNGALRLADTADGNSSYPLDQVIAARQNAIKINEELNNSITQYYEAWAVLRSLGANQADQFLMSTASEAQPVSLSPGRTVIPMPRMSFRTTIIEPPGPIDPKIVQFNNIRALVPDSLGPGEMEYPNGPEGMDMFIQSGEFQTSPVGSLSRILIHDSNIFSRSTALNLLLTQYADQEGFLPAVKKILLGSPYPDVALRLFKFMTDRKEDHDLPFLIQIIHQAFRQNNRTIADLGLDFLGDLIQDYPAILEKLIPSDFIMPTGSADYPDVSPDTANRVFVTLLLKTDNPMTVDRVFQSNYFSPDDWAKIYHEITAYTNAHQGEEGINKEKKFAEQIKKLIKRKLAEKHVEEIFRQGSFATLGPVERMLFPADFISNVQMADNARANKEFLEKSPQWPQMHRYIQPRLDASAEQETESLVSKNSVFSGAASGAWPAPFYHFWGNHQSIFPSYFLSLGVEGKKKFIKSADNMELARILELRTPLRALALKRLMDTPEGRILTWQAYLNSTDVSLERLIASNFPSLRKNIKNDIESVNTPSANGILRRALLKTGQPWAKYARLGLMSSIELSQADRSAQEQTLIDDQVDGRIATQRALEVIQQKLKATPEPWAGYTMQSPGVEQEILGITRKIEGAENPKDISDYVNQRIKSVTDSEVKDMLSDLISIRERIAGEIKANDQYIPKFPGLYVFLLKALGAASAFLLGKRFISWMKKKKAEIPELLKILQREMNRRDRRIRRNIKNGGDNGNNGDKYIITISQDMYDPVIKPLETWQNLVGHWPQDKSAQDLLSDLNTILNNAAEVLRLMPYSPDLIWSSTRPLNAEYVKSYSSFYELAAQTLYLLSNRLQDANLTQIQRLRFLQDIDAMLEMMRYVSRFLRVLQYRGNIVKVMSYKFADNHWTEWHGWGPYVWARTVLLYETLWKNSERKLKMELPQLLDEGDLLMPGFYKDRDALITQSKERLKEVTENGETTSDSDSPDGGNRHKLRSFRSRMLVLAGLSTILVTIAAVFFGFPWLVLGSTISSSFFTLFTLFSFWIPHLDILSMSWNRTMNMISDKLDSKLNNLLDPSGTYKNDHRTTEQKIEDLAKQEGLKEIAMELDPKNSPRIDTIVIVAEDKKDVGALEEYVHKNRGKIIRRDIPIEVVCPESKGSGNAYLDALLMVKNKFQTGVYKKEYPHLKSWENARVMFVFYGQDAPHSGDNIIINLAIANGYRAAASMSQFLLPNEPSKGNIIIYARDDYFGPIQQVAGSQITPLISWVNRDELKRLAWINSEFPNTGDPEVHEFLEKLDVPLLLEEDRRKRRGSKTVRYMKSKLYDLSNSSLRQFSAFNGMILMRANAVDMFVKIAEGLESSGLREKLRRISFTSDLLTPLLFEQRQDSGDDLGRTIDDYVGERSRWPDMTGKGAGPSGNGRLRAIQDALTEFYGIVRRAMRPSITINAFFPHPWSEVYHIVRESVGGAGTTGPPDAAQVSEHAVISAAEKSRGGIDLNFQPQFIQRGSRTNSAFAGFPIKIRPDGTSGRDLANLKDWRTFGNGIEEIPEEFKGFNFNIVRFTSELTVNGAFQLMFNSD